MVGAAQLPGQMSSQTMPVCLARACMHVPGRYGLHMLRGTGAWGTTQLQWQALHSCHAGPGCQEQGVRSVRQTEPCSATLAGAAQLPLQRRRRVSAQTRLPHADPPQALVSIKFQQTLRPGMALAGPYRVSPKFQTHQAAFSDPGTFQLMRLCRVLHAQGAAGQRELSPSRGGGPPALLFPAAIRGAGQAADSPPEEVLPEGML